ncbi:hypothetical protein [Aquimarina spongiae]|uniref:Uncharacterized protein n=1 Tax=Aquimarina spongiae TaxID=570521 RepID=A0A1M6HZ50_9FLAO|nr:hypothetical protein [Aquimarina spongiae]SHJ27528.1 hypothetical protein SAMN04488508_1079 [Aquimarina spongiae]
MSWRVIWIGVLFLGLLSCDSFVLKKENKEDIVKDRLNKLNWHDVEQPPFFNSCKNRAEEELEICFQQTITQHIQEHLAKQSFSVNTAIEDTIWIPLLITKDSEILLQDFELPDIIISEIPNLKDLLKEGISTLPEVAPAHTRSTPVTALYKLPLVIRIN